MKLGRASSFFRVEECFHFLICVILLYNFPVAQMLNKQAFLFPLCSSRKERNTSSASPATLAHEYTLLLLLSPLYVCSKQTNAACCHGSYGNYWLTQPQGRPKMQSRAHLCVFVAHTCACVVVSVETSPLRTKIHSLLSSYQSCMSTLCGVTPTSVTCCLHFTLNSSPTRLA